VKWGFKRRESFRQGEDFGKSRRLTKGEKGGARGSYTPCTFAGREIWGAKLDARRNAPSGTSRDRDEIWENKADWKGD